MARVVAWLAVGAVLACAAPSRAGADAPGSDGARVVPPADAPYLVVLGVAQDAGAPQAGTHEHAGFHALAARRHAACLGLVDPRDGRRWLLEATPDLREQLHALDHVAPPRAAPPSVATPDAARDIAGAPSADAPSAGAPAADAPAADAPSAHPPHLAGVFLTHAHVGHYLGLAQLGHEVMGARGVPVHVMPRFAAFLRHNGPWDQLVRYGNVELRELAAGEPVSLAPDLRVTPLRVPHREEYSEVVAFRVDGPRRSALFLPDIDGWERLDAAGARIEHWIAAVDVAFLDGTFFDGSELPGRDLSAIPHPFIAESLARFAALPARERAKIRFLHLNHSNPALDPDSPERARVEAAGMAVAREGELVEL